MSIPMHNPTAPEARHIGQIFFQRVEELGAQTFIYLQSDGGFEEISWRDFGAMVRGIILALFGLGLTPGEAVAIIGENSFQRACADLATLAGGFPNVIVAPASSDALLLKVLQHAECRAAFVENEVGVGRLLNMQGQLPALAHIFMMSQNRSRLPRVLGFDDLVERGGARDDTRLGTILESIHTRDLATIMYTSGSTGEPKGVMRTHENLLSNITNGGEIVVSRPDDLFVIVLSLNHLLGRFGFLKSAITGRTTAIIKATEMEVDLKVIQSLGGTAMAVVPRVMQRIWNSMLDRNDNRHQWETLEALDQKNSATGLDAAEKESFAGLQAGLKTAARQSLGGRMKYVSYSGAAMPARIMRFFELVGIPLIGAYGSTECGGVTLCGIGENRPGNLGKPFPNVEVRIADDGEILVRGPTVSPGYFQNPEATREVFDPDGWYHTGDLGALEEDGSLRIVGRKKDIFYCADGSNIYPAFIELQLESDAFIRQAVLVGDHRPFIAALVVPEYARVAEALACSADVLTDQQIRTMLDQRIARLNARLEHFERIQKFLVMKDDFPLEVRSVNAFQKVKVDRKKAAEHFQKQIAEIYATPPEEPRL